MTATKSIINRTGYTITVTLYICGREAGVTDNFGTRRFVLVPGQLADIPYGDIRHSFLAGIKLESDVQGMHVEQKQMVLEAGDKFDRYLNSASEITLRDINLPLTDVC